MHVRFGEDLIVAKLGAHRIPNFGDDIELAMNTEAIHVFDPETELTVLHTGE